MSLDDYFPSIYEIKGVGKKIGEQLIKAGYQTVAEVARASPDELPDIPNLKAIIRNAREHIREKYDGEFLRITGIGDATARILFENGLLFPEEVAKVDITTLADVISEKAASRIKNYATKFVDSVDSMLEGWEIKLGIPYDIGRKLYLNGILSTREISEEALSYFLPQEDVDKILDRLSLIKDDGDDEVANLFSMFDGNGESEKQLYEESVRKAIIELNRLVDDYNNGKITDLNELNERVIEVCNPLIEFHSSTGATSSVIDYYMKKSSEGILLNLAGAVDPISGEILPKENWPQPLKDVVLIRDYCEYCNVNIPPELEVLAVLQPDLDETELIVSTVLKMYQDIADDNLPESCDYKTAEELDKLLEFKAAFESVGVPEEQAKIYAKIVHQFAETPEDLKSINPNINIRGIPPEVLKKVINKK
jgi:predicted flap endonuclease-1-like 5' DNA nuclease